VIELSYQDIFKPVHSANSSCKQRKQSLWKT